MNEVKWETVRQFYMESFGIAPELVDLMASNEILLMCVSGSSNESISRILNVDKESVAEILDVILTFPGWEKDLDFSPYRIFKEDSSFIGFTGQVLETIGPEDAGINLQTIKIMYNNCKIYESIEEKLEIGWK